MYFLIFNQVININNKKRSMLQLLCGAAGWPLTLYSLVGTRRKKKTDKLLILSYHRIVNDLVKNEFCNNHYFLNLPVKIFIQQLRWVRSNYKIIGLDDLLSEVQLPSRVALITFDDGFRNVYEIAFPILKSMGIPATIFLIGSLVREDKILWITHLHWLMDRVLEKRIQIPGIIDNDNILFASRIALILKDLKKKLKLLDIKDIRKFLSDLEQKIGITIPKEIIKQQFMREKEIREVCSYGWTIGNHTDNHLDLCSLSPERCQYEIVESHKTLSKFSGYRNVLALPFGGGDSFSPETTTIAHNNGVEYLFTTMGGLNDYPPSDKLLNRVICETFSNFYFYFLASGSKNEINNILSRVIKNRRIF